MKQNTKDWVQYSSAMMLIASAIAMAFVSFLMTEDIGGGPLAYIGEALAASLAIFGVAAYFVNQMAQFKADVRREIEEKFMEESRERTRTEPEETTEQ